MNEQIGNKEEITEDIANELADKYIELADLDGNGTIDLEEMKTFMNKMDGAPDDCEDIFKQIDTDGDGEITKDEFAKLIMQVVNDKNDEGDE